MTAADETRRQYELERRLAERLRSAPKASRGDLYAAVYRELFDRFPHLTATSTSDRAARRHQVELEMRLLEPFLSPEVSMIEFGTGDGSLAVAAAGRAARVWGVDVAVRGAVETSSTENPQWIDCAAPPLPLADGSCELAYSCHFVEHLHPEDLDDHLRDAHRLLVPGGRYVCVTPNRLLGPHDVSKHFTTVATGLHLREYTHRELIARFAAAGFRRTAVLRRIGYPAAHGETKRYLLAERLVGLMPRRMRLALLSSPPLGRTAPFRPFEQVKIVASK